MAFFVLAAIAIGAAALYQCIIHPLFLSPISDIPAVHPLAKLTSLYMIWIRYRDIENATVFEAHQKYGDVVRLSPKELSVNCIDDGVKTIYGKNFDRHNFYSIYEDFGRKNVSSSLDAIPHGLRKKRITQVYSKSYVHSSPAIAGLIDRVIRQGYLGLITGCAKDDRPFNTMQLVSALGLDFVTGYTFGVQNGTNFLNNLEEHAEFLHEMHNGWPYEIMFWFYELPGTLRFLERTGLLYKGRSKSLETFHNFCLNMGDRAEKSLNNTSTQEIAPEEYPTVYQHFKRNLEKEGMSATPFVEKYSQLLCSEQQLEIAAEVADHVHSADETMSTTLTYAFWELSRRPDMQSRLRLECQSLGSSINSASSTEPLPSPPVVDKLPLLHAILMETLRLHPVIAGGQARVTPYGKLSKLGQYENIPGGYRVQSYARFLHQNTDVFPDPLAWYPERWLSQDGDTESAGHDQKMRWFWSFSSGGRMCVGSNLAMVVMKYVLALTYANFETHVVDDDGIEHMEGFVGGPKSGKLFIGAKAL